MDQPVPLSTFHDSLLAALQLALNPAALGAESPLAASYFLGSYLSAQPETLRQQEIGRGKALVSLLEDAIADMAIQHPKGEEYEKILLVSFFQRRTKFDDSAWDVLAISRAQYFRNRKEAIHALELTVIRRVNPALRSESPFQLPFFAGRETEIQVCRTALANNQIMGLAGPSGIGKTSLVAQAVADFSIRPVFWHTIHLGINDHLGSVMFALAHFLHSHGASHLWMQLAADRDQADIDTLSGLLRSDLAALASQNPIFCFDEIDLLQAELEAHAQLLNFLEGFPKGFALLLVGQTIPLLTDTFVDLEPISSDVVHQILKRHGISLAVESLRRIEAYTKGNPRLLTLYIALHISGESLEELLHKIGDTPSLEALVNRVWPRLNDEERDIMLHLAVFRRPVPADVWYSQSQRAALMLLIRRQLVQSDGLAAVAILPAYRRAIYDSVPTETRDLLHAEAASIRSARSEYTAAAFHLTRAGKPDEAVRLWYSHRMTEIDQGQASAALHLFGDISQNQISDQTTIERLGLIRGELHRLLGNYDKAQATLRAIPWRTPRLSALARRLEGDVAELKGELDIAANAYQAGLALLETELALFHRDIGWIYRRQKRLDIALKEINLAQFQIEILKGHVYRDLGDFIEASDQYHLALKLAQDSKNADSEAITRNALAAVMIKQGRFAEAEAHFDQAYAIFRRIGKIMSVASVRVNQAVACLLDSRAQDAIGYAEQASTIFEQIRHPYGMATAYQSLAEAYLAGGESEQSELYAWKAVETEESTIIPDALRVIGEIYLARGDQTQAHSYMHQALDSARENQDRYLEAYALRSLGKAYLPGDRAQADLHLAQAESLFAEIGLQDEVERTRNLVG